MNFETIQATEKKLLLSTYERNPLLFERGEGVYLIDEKGERYLDLLSGIGVNALGYGHTAIEEAIGKQSKLLIHTSNLYYHHGQAELALRLTERTGLDRVFFANTGTEAWEAAMKLSRAYAGLLRSEGKQIGTKFLALEQSFHGRTFGSVSTTHKAKYREPFGPVVPGVEFVRFNDVSDLKAKFSNEVCAVLVESIQGEGGIRPLSQEFFAAARELTQSTGALLVADEIQAGLGRTGKWFAYQHYGILPDVTTVAKPLAGGYLPLGALIVTDAIADHFNDRVLWLGLTYSAHPVSCAAGLEVLKIYEDEHLIENAAAMGRYVDQQVARLREKHPCIGDWRNTGLLGCLEIVRNRKTKEPMAPFNAKPDEMVVMNQVGARLKQLGMYTFVRWNYVFIAPPLCITREQVDEGLAMISDALTIADQHVTN